MMTAPTLLEADRLVQDLATRLAGLDGVRRLYCSRSLPGRRPDLPALMIYLAEEDMADFGGGAAAPSFDVTAALVVEIAVSGADEAADALLARVRAAVLSRLLQDPDWVRQFTAIQRVRTVIAIPDGGDVQYLGAQIRIEVTYRAEWAPNVPDRLAAIGITVDCIDPSDPSAGPAGPDGRPELTALIDLPA